jgi:predicted dienelactone hydrolase
MRMSCVAHDPTVRGTQMPLMRGRKFAFFTAASLTLMATRAITAVAETAQAPSRPAIDAPELAPLGGHRVGIRTLTFIDRNAVDVTHVAPDGAVDRRDRVLKVDLWYPAQPVPGSVAETYHASLPSEGSLPPAVFSVPGIAVRDARPAPGRYPLVIVSHGYSNATVAMSWLTENLASKGYVVAAIRHEDPPITDPTGLPEVLLRRPLDIAFVAHQLQHDLAAQGLVDATRVALVGYSVGGYGVLTAAGAVLDPNGGACTRVPHGELSAYAAGGPSAGALTVVNLKAVIAISPAGGALQAWGSTGLQGISAPILFIAGDHDLTVDYQSGARAFFEAATHTQRYLLTFKGAGHALGLNTVPAEMRQKLWDFDWFEDDVWRKERIIGINLHFITAFLDRFLKDDLSRSAYLDVPVADSQLGEWSAKPDVGYGAFSPGGDGVTLWKGFQRRHAQGLELLRAAAELTPTP